MLYDVFEDFVEKIRQFEYHIAIQVIAVMVKVGFHADGSII
jgi:hypothetical protein